VVKSDSKLLVNQMRGDWKVEAVFLVPLHRKAMFLIKDLDISFKWISREGNKEADSLADSAYQGSTRR